MIRLHRPTRPTILAREPEWRQEHLRRLASNPKYSFEWPKLENNQSLSVPLRAALAEMSANHCSYCDGFPLGVLSHSTIDHFRPKSAFPRSAFAWSNLFLACTRCQFSKRSIFNERLLKPDANKYRFGYYFHYSAFFGELKVNTDAPKEFQERARFTLNTFNLNAPELRSDRKRWYRLYYKSGIALNEAPYRFIYQVKRK
jgi:uncharacterized protein (TIGR02646 family)